MKFSDKPSDKLDSAPGDTVDPLPNPPAKWKRKSGFKSSNHTVDGPAKSGYHQWKTVVNIPFLIEQETIMKPGWWLNQPRWDKKRNSQYSWKTFKKSMFQSTNQQIISSNPWVFPVFFGGKSENLRMSFIRGSSLLKCSLVSRKLCRPQQSKLGIIRHILFLQSELRHSDIFETKIPAL